MPSKTLDPTTATAAELRQAAEHTTAWAEKAAAREREAAVVAEAAAQRVAQERRAAAQAKLAALELPPEPEQCTDDVELLESKTIGPRELLVRILGFDNVDSHQDVIMSTAADAWMAATAPESVPLLYLHERTSVPLGVARSFKKDSLGIIGHFQLFDSERASEALAMAKKLLAVAAATGNTAARAGASIGYRALAHHWGQLGGKTVRFLDRIQISEVSLTPATWQSNLQAQVLEAKSLAAAAVHVTPKTIAECRAELAELDQWMLAHDYAEFQAQCARRRQNEEKLAELAAYQRPYEEAQARAQAAAEWHAKVDQTIAWQEAREAAEAERAAVQAKARAHARYGLPAQCGETWR